MVKLEDLFLEIKNGKNVEQFDEIGKYRVSCIQTIADGNVNLEKTKWTNDEINDTDFLQYGDILLSHINSFEHLAKTAIFKSNVKVIHVVNLIKFRANQEKISPEYAIYVFKSTWFINKAKSFAQKAVSQASIKVVDLKTIQIPLPPLEVQEEIVKELDGYQAVIDGAQKVIDNWKPTLPINPNWEKVVFENIYSIPSKNGLTKPTAIRGNGYKMINMGELFQYNKIGNIPMALVPLSENEIKLNDIQVGDLLFARQSLVVSGAGKCSIVVDVPEYTTFESHIIRV